MVATNQQFGDRAQSNGAGGLSSDSRAQSETPDVGSGDAITTDGAFRTLDIDQQESVVTIGGGI